MNIKCGDHFVCFIDNKYQCYWSPSNGDKNINHFQALDDNKYQGMNIRHVVFEEDLNVIKPEIWLFDIDNKILYFDGEELKIFESNIALNGNTIVSVGWGNCSPLIFVKQQLCL